MNWIYQKITELTGVTDQAEVEQIYGFMADNVRAFGSLTPAQWRKEAREAKMVVDYLKTPEGKAEWDSLTASTMGVAA